MNNEDCLRIIHSFVRANSTSLLEDFIEWAGTQPTWGMNAYTQVIWTEQRIDGQKTRVQLDSMPEFGRKVDGRRELLAINTFSHPMFEFTRNVFEKPLKTTEAVRVGIAMHYRSIGEKMIGFGRFETQAISRGFVGPSSLGITIEEDEFLRLLARGSQEEDTVEERPLKRRRVE